MGTLRRAGKKVIEVALSILLLLIPISLRMEVHKIYGQVKEVGWFESIFGGEQLNKNELKFYYYNYLNNETYFEKLHKKKELDLNNNGFIDEEDLKELVLQKLDEGDVEVFRGPFGNWGVKITLGGYNDLGILMFFGKDESNNLYEIALGLTFGSMGGPIGYYGNIKPFLEEYEMVYGEEFQYPTEFDVEANGMDAYKDRFLKLAALVIEKHLSTVKLRITAYKHKATGTYLMAAFVRLPINLDKPDAVGENGKKYEYRVYSFNNNKNLPLKLTINWYDRRKLAATDVFSMGSILPDSKEKPWIAVYFEGEILEPKNKDGKNYFVAVISSKIENFDKEKEKVYVREDKSQFNLPDTIKVVVHPILDFDK